MPRSKDLSLAALERRIALLTELRSNAVTDGERRSLDAELREMELQRQGKPIGERGP